MAALLLTLVLMQSPAGLPEVAAVDLSRYAGTWYEQARFDTFFQKGCFGSSATYTLQPSGEVKVENRCHQDAPDGPLKGVVGKAWAPDPAVPGKLRVQFFWPFSGPYWVLEVAEDYRWALVGHPDRTRCWIFTRTPTVEPALYEALVEKLKARGYDVSRLVRAL